MKKIGKQMKLIRTYYKKSVYDIEKDTQIPHQALYGYEQGKRTPSIIVCIKLADFYNISLDELVGRDFF